MSPKERQEAFAALCQRMHTEMGGKATAQEVALHVASALGSDGYRARTWRGFVTQVGTQLRASDSDGLVRAAAIDGTYVQRTLWTEDDYVYVVRGHIRRSRNDRRLAYAYAAECEARYGVAINPAEVSDTG